MRKHIFLFLIFCLLFSLGSDKKLVKTYWICDVTFKVSAHNYHNYIRVVEAKSEKEARTKFLAYCRKFPEIETAPIQSCYTTGDNLVIIKFNPKEDIIK